MPVPRPLRPPEAELSSYREAGGHGSGSATSQAAKPIPDPRPNTSDDAELIAHAIRRAGMSAPAALLLGTFKPLAWLGGQLLWALEPLLGGFTRHPRDGVTLRGLARFLEQEGSVDDLLDRLQAMRPGRRR